jgi:hypothetical protein
MIPSTGRIVHYILSDSDVGYIRSLRTARAAVGGLGGGNAVTAGDQYPMIITRIWASPETVTEHTSVQGQVFLDGPDTLWVTSRGQGDQPGQWHDPREFPAPPKPAVQGDPVDSSISHDPFAPEGTTPDSPPQAPPASAPDEPVTSDAPVVAQEPAADTEPQDAPAPDPTPAAESAGPTEPAAVDPSPAAQSAGPTEPDPAPVADITPTQETGDELPAA